MAYEITEEVIVGTNEEFLLGYNINKAEDESYSFEASFTNHSHSGRVKTLTVSGKYLVSGGSDEYMRIFNLLKRTEVGSITPHEATITCVQFHSNSFLLTGAENGKIGIYKKEKWKPLKFLPGHKSAISGIGIHPSGKLAHTTSRDRKMLTWDLTKGKRLYINTLKTPADDVQWSPTGSHYVVTRDKIIDVYTLEVGNVIYSIDFDDKICALKFITDDVFICGGEGKDMYFYDIKSRNIILQWESGQSRVKCLSLLSNCTAEEGVTKMLSASSDGTIKLWKFENTLKEIPVELAVINTTCRIICMGVYTRKISRFETETVTQEEESETISSEEEGGYSDLELSKNNVFGVGTEFIGKKSIKRKRVCIAKESMVIEEEDDSYVYKPTITEEHDSEEGEEISVRKPRVLKKKKVLKKAKKVKETISTKVNGKKAKKVEETSSMKVNGFTVSESSDGKLKSNVKKSKLLKKKKNVNGKSPRSILKKAKNVEE